MAANVAGPSKLYSTPGVEGMNIMYNHNGGNNTQLSSGNSETTVYPPQPYALQQGDPSNSTQTSPSTSATKTNKSDNLTDNTSTGSAANGLARKRGANNSPGNEAKEKKARGDSQDDSNSPGTKALKSGATGTPIDARAWGEEASKLDVYVWDYITRRGFTRAAKALVNDAGMTEAPDVPLKTPQGLLFEYWAIFWDVFAARTGRGSAEATTYHEYQENRQAQKLNEVARRLEATESGYHVPENQASRFPPVMMGGNVMGAGATGSDAPQGSSAAANMMSQMQARNAAAAAANGQMQQSGQQQMLNKAGQQQQQQQPPSLGASQGWNQAANPLQQQTQMLFLAAQRHNIPIDDIKNMNPAMRNALIQSVTTGGGNVPGVPMGASIRPPGMTPGMAGGPSLDPNMQQRIQQQQQLHRQMQRNINPGAAQGGNIRPAGMVPNQQISSPAPGTPASQQQQSQSQQPPQQQAQQQQQGNTQTDGRRSTGPGQGQGQGQSGGQGGANNVTPQQQQQPLPNQQGQPGGPITPGGNMIRPGMPSGTSMQGQQQQQQQQGNDSQKHPTLTPEQQQMLMAQHQNLQHTLRNELHQAQVAPTPAIAERAFQTAQQIQLRLAQLGALLKAQPQFQQQTAAHAQQQQQPPQMGIRPGMPAPGQALMPMSIPPGLNPQQQQQFLAQRAQMAAAQQRMGTQNMAGNEGNGMMMPGMVNGRPPPGSSYGHFDGTQAQPMASQQQQQQQQGNLNGNGSDFGGSDQQQRSHFAFANPFAAQAAQNGNRRTSNAPPGEDNNVNQNGATFHQSPQQYGGATPNASGSTLQRPGMANRMHSGMGPPIGQNISASSPRLPNHQSQMQEGSVGGSPATNPPIPSTPKTTTAEKKKKETRSRKNSKAASIANKTPVMTAANTSTNSTTATTTTTGQTPLAAAAQAPTPASSHAPTPGKDATITTKGGGGGGANSTVNTPAMNRNTELPVNTTSSSSSTANAMATSSLFDPSSFTSGNVLNHTDGTSLNNVNMISDDSSQIFANGDMSQFFNDFEFSTGNAFGSTDSTGLGGFGDWDNSNLGTLFGDSMT